MKTSEFGVFGGLLAFCVCMSCIYIYIYSEPETLRLLLAEDLVTTFSLLPKKKLSLYSVVNSFLICNRSDSHYLVVL